MASFAAPAYSLNSGLVVPEVSLTICFCTTMTMRLAMVLRWLTVRDWFFSSSSTLSMMPFLISGVSSSELTMPVKRGEISYTSFVPKVGSTFT